MKTTQQIQRLNALVEEFDKATAFEFERETDEHFIILAAGCWATVRRSLAGDLARAFAAVASEKGQS